MRFIAARKIYDMIVMGGDPKRLRLRCPAADVGMTWMTSLSTNFLLAKECSI